MAAVITSSKSLSVASILVSTGIATPQAAASSSSEAVYAVDLTKLEGYFQSLNKQLYDNKADIHMCVSEYLYKEEVKQRAQTSLKVDHLLADMNLLKDYVYNDTASGYRQQPNKQDKVAMLKGEVEALKSYIRRLELQQCENVNIYSRVKGIESQHTRLANDLQELRSRDTLAGIRAEMAASKEEVLGVITEVKADYTNKLAVIETILKESDAQRKVASLEEDMQEFSQRLREAELMLDEQNMNVINALNSIDQLANDMANMPVPSMMTTRPTTPRVLADPSATPRGVPGAVSVDMCLSSLPAVPLPSAMLNINVAAASSALEEDDNMSVRSSFSVSAPVALVPRQSVRASFVSKQPSFRHTGAKEEVKTPARGTIIKPAGRLTMTAAVPSINMDQMRAEFATLKDVEVIHSNMAILTRHADHLADSLQSLRGLIIYRTLKRCSQLHKQSTVRRRFAQMVAFYQSTKSQAQATYKEKVERVIACLSKLSVSYTKQCFFSRWHTNSTRVFKYNKLKKWIRNKLMPYYQQYEPNLLEYVERWKTAVVDSYKDCLFDGDQGHITYNMEEGSVESAAVPYVVSGMQRSNRGTKRGSMLRSSIASISGTRFSVDNLKKLALDDLRNRWSFAEQEEEDNAKQQLQLQSQEGMQTQMSAQLQAFKDEVYAAIKDEQGKLMAQLSSLENELNHTKKSLNRTIATLEEEKSDVSGIIEGHVNKLQSALNNYKSSVTVKLSYMKESLDDSVKAIEATVGNHVQRLEILEGRDDETNKLKDKFVHEVGLIHCKIEAYLLQYEDIYQYLYIFKEQIAQHTQHITLINSHHHDLLTDYTANVKLNNEQHYYLDEEVKWVKQIIQEQYAAFSTMKDSYARQFNEISIVLNKSDDPEVMLGDIDSLLTAGVLDNVKRYIAWQIINAYLDNSGSANMLTLAVDKHYKQGHLVRLAMIGCARKITALITMYADQEYLLHHSSTLISAVRQDYSNDFLGMYAVKDMTAAALRDKMLAKVMRDLDGKVNAYMTNPNILLTDMVDYMNEQNITSPANAAANMNFFSPSKKDYAKMKHNYLNTLRSLLTIMLGNHSLPRHPTGLEEDKVATRRASVANLAAMSVRSPDRDAQTANNTLLNAYNTFRSTSPPRQIVYISNNDEPSGKVLTATGLLRRPKSAPGKVKKPDPLVVSHSAASLPTAGPSSPMIAVHVTKAGNTVDFESSTASSQHSPARSPVHTVKPFPVNGLETGSSIVFSGPHNNSQISVGSGTPRAASPAPLDKLSASDNVMINMHSPNKKKVVAVYLDHQPRTEMQDVDMETFNESVLHELDHDDNAITEHFQPTVPTKMVMSTSNVAMSTLVAFSAVEQHGLAQALADQLPSDRTFHPKHEEPFFSQQVEEDEIAFLARPLRGRNQT